MGTRKFQQQVSDQWRRLYRVAYVWCHDAQLAMDLTQDTMAKALRQQSQLRETDALDRWLFTILLNNWRDYCRQHREMLEINESSAIHEQTPELQSSNQEALERVQQACRRLNQDQREVLSLVVLEGLSYADTANVMGVSVGTVMSRLCRARESLRNELTRMGEPSAGGQVTPFRRMK